MVVVVLSWLPSSLVTVVGCSMGIMASRQDSCCNTQTEMEYKLTFAMYTASARLSEAIVGVNVVGCGVL